jgi:hypothetical protein
MQRGFVAFIEFYKECIQLEINYRKTFFHDKKALESAVDFGLNGCPVITFHLLRIRCWNANNCPSFKFRPVCVYYCSTYYTAVHAGGG